MSGSYTAGAFDMIEAGKVREHRIERFKNGLSERANTNSRWCQQGAVRAGLNHQQFRVLLRSTSNTNHDT